VSRATVRLALACVAAGAALALARSAHATGSAAAPAFFAVQPGALGGRLGAADDGTPPADDALLDALGVPRWTAGDAWKARASRPAELFSASDTIEMAETRPPTSRTAVEVVAASGWPVVVARTRPLVLRMAWASSQMDFVMIGVCSA
jgi:hypothetical protein